MLILGSPKALLLLTLAGACIVPQITRAGQTATDVISVQTDVEPGGAHRVIRWAEAELAEMDATITTLDEDTLKLQGEARTRADAVLAKLRATRDAYRVKLQQAAAAGEEKTKGEVERLHQTFKGDWTAFEADIEEYYDTVDADFQTRRAVFIARANAQRAAFERRIDELRQSAADATTEAKAKTAAEISALEASLQRSREKIDRLGEATDAAWTQFLKGLDDARETFRASYD